MGSIIHKWLAYELLEGRKCVRLISESLSPSPVPGTLQLLSNTELKQNKRFVLQTPELCRISI